MQMQQLHASMRGGSSSAAFEMLQREENARLRRPAHLQVLVAKCFSVKLLVCAALALVAASNAPTGGGSTIITSVSYVFEAFSPNGLIRFFEFSDRGWNISENCLRDMYNYVEGLRRGALWAVKLYDASGYYAGGAFGGASNIRIHSPELCRTLQLQHVDALEQQQLLQLRRRNLRDNVTLAPPFAVQIVLGQYLLELADGRGADGLFKFAKVQQLICFPKSCSDPDLQQILEMSAFQSNHIVRNNTYLRHRIVRDDYDVFHDFEFYMLITVLSGALSIFAAVHLLGNYISRVNANHNHNETGNNKSRNFEENPNVPVDCQSALRLNIKRLIGIASESENTRSVNFVVEEPNCAESVSNRPKIVTKSRTHRLEEFLNAISLPTVIYTLFESAEATPQSGIFVIFTACLVYAHVAAEIRFMSSNLHPDAVQQQPHTDLVLRHVSYTIDVYFFLSGSKLASQFFRTFPREKLNVFEQLASILKLMLLKIFCLMPSYTFCLFVEHLLDKHFRNNAAMEIPSNDYNNCKDNKFSNVLYMDTFFPLTERCMPWTWFMSLEVQFFIIACLVLLLAEIHQRYAVIIGSTIFVISLLAASVWELNSHRQFGYVTSIEYELSHFNLVFDNICLRIAPFLLGICLGYILHRTDSSINLNVFVLISGWIACVLVLCFFFLGFEVVLSRVNQLARAFLVTLAHTMWSMVLMWTVLTGITQHGEFLASLLCFRYSQTLEKLSPICLLIAPIVIRLLVFTADAPIYSSGGQIFAIAIGCLLTTYACALVLHVLLDAPLLTIFQEVFRKFS